MNEHECYGNHFRGVAEMVSPFTMRAYHAFVATQAEEKLRREGIKGKTKASQTLYEVGAKVCQTIRELGGTLPEDVPTPHRGAKQSERARNLEGRE